MYPLSVQSFPSTGMSRTVHVSKGVFEGGCQTLTHAILSFLFYLSLFVASLVNVTLTVCVIDCHLLRQSSTQHVILLVIFLCACFYPVVCVCGGGGGVRRREGVKLFWFLLQVWKSREQEEKVVWEKGGWGVWRKVNKNRKEKMMKEKSTREERKAQMDFYLAGSGAVYLGPSAKGWCTSRLRWGPRRPPAVASPLWGIIIIIIIGNLLGSSGGVVNSLDFCLASLKSLGCFYFRCILSSQWKAVTVNLQILHCQL